MSRRLRIVSVCRSLPTPEDRSSGIFVLNRLAALSQLADARVVQPVPYLPGVRPLPRWAMASSRIESGVEILHAPMLYLPGVLKSADGRWLARAIEPIVRKLHQERAIDAIDAHFAYPEGVGCAQVARRLGVPLFITIRGFENEYVEKPGIAPQMLAAMRSADGCISVSHSLREMAMRHGVKPERLHVVHNAIDLEVFHAGDRETARRRLGVAGPLIVGVGHLVSRKRHHVLIEAFARVRRELPVAQLAIIGAKSFEPDYPALLERAAARLDVADAVSVKGNLPPRQVADWLRAADLFALATAREGCCNAVLEALAVGTPVVTTPAGDNARFVRDGENGFVVPIDDVEAMAIKLRRALVGQTWDRLAIAQALQASVGSWSDVAERVLAFMDQRIGAAEERPASVS